MTARFEVSNTLIEGLKVVQRLSIRDSRGYFSRLYCAEEFQLAKLSPTIAQINQSYSETQGTVRGLHFQLPPHAETKYVSCIRGEIFDVAVDLRQGSPTFLKWHGEVLSEQNQRSLLIPEGFAHGFQTLTDGCELLYLVSASYAADSEGGLNAKDPLIGIEWPRAFTEVSDKDRNVPYLPINYSGIDLESGL